MKIKHGTEIWTRDFIVKGEDRELNGYAAPHECTVPHCPGDLNRRKLELFEEMREALDALITSPVVRGQGAAIRDNARRNGTNFDPFERAIETVAKARELK